MKTFYRKEYFSLSRENITTMNSSAWRLIAAFILSAALILCGCSPIDDISSEETEQSVSEDIPQPYPVTVAGYTFNESPKTVCSLSPAVTEIICALGYEDRIILRSSYCDYPESILSVPDAGSSANPDIGKIAEYSPVLLISQTPIANKDVKQLEGSGTTVLILDSPSSNEELFGLYLSLSEIFAGSLESEAISENALSDYKAALSYANNSCESLALIMQTLDGSFSVGTGDSFAGDYISCFGRNIAADNTSYTMTAEELIAADPEVIFLAHPLGSEDIDPEIREQLSAFENGRVYVIDTSLLERPTARLAEITKTFADALSAGAD
ncbi:MAG: ABC transporter substrate-binding protein [Huintestinicola sp.]